MAPINTRNASHGMKHKHQMLSIICNIETLKKIHSGMSVKAYMIYRVLAHLQFMTKRNRENQSFGKIIYIVPD